MLIILVKSVVNKNKSEYYYNIFLEIKVNSMHFFFIRKIFIRKCEENLQPQMPELQFFKRLIFLRAHRS